jgi:copper chaperone CopZ
MKKLILGAVLIMSMSAFAAEVSVKVSGMVCSMCAQGIEKKFSKEPAVKNLKVDLDQKLVTINTHEGKDVSDEVVKKLITEAGYNVAEITRK